MQSLSFQRIADAFNAQSLTDREQSIRNHTSALESLAALGAALKALGKDKVLSAEGADLRQQIAQASRALLPTYAMVYDRKSCLAYPRTSHGIQHLR